MSILSLIFGFIFATNPSVDSQTDAKKLLASKTQNIQPKEALVDDLDKIEVAVETASEAIDEAQGENMSGSVEEAVETASEAIDEAQVENTSGSVKEVVEAVSEALGDLDVEKKAEDVSTQKQ